MRPLPGESKRPAREREAVSARSPNALQRASERIEQIRAATARAASEIRADAESLGAAQGPASEREQMVLQLLEFLADRTARLDNEGRRLAGVLGRGAVTLETRSRPSAGEPTGASERSKPPSVSTPARRNGAAEKPATKGTRLLALQMVVAGGSRDEIEARLRGEFEVEDEDVDAVLDEIFGSVPQ